MSRLHLQLQDFSLCRQLRCGTDGPQSSAAHGFEAEGKRCITVAAESRAELTAWQTADCDAPAIDGQDCAY